MPEHTICRNCGYQTTAFYCANCGQKNDVGRLRITSLADSFVSSFVGDGAVGEKRSNVRYGFMLTIWSVISRPGQTVAEFLEGRRRKYFNPVTILLLLSGLYGLIGVYFGVMKDTPAPSKHMLGHYFNLISTYIDTHPAFFYLMLLPFTALAYKWIFRKYSALRYVEYLYVGIFTGLFSILLLFVQLPFRSEALGHLSEYMTTLMYVAQCWFSVAVFRRLFKVSVRRGVWCWIKTIMISYPIWLITSFIMLIIGLFIYHLVDPEGLKEVLTQFTINLDEATEPAPGFHDAMQSARQAADSLQTK